MSTKLTNTEAESVVRNVLPSTVSTEDWIPEEVRNLEAKGVVTVLPIEGLVTNPDNPRDGNWSDDVADLVGEISRLGYDKSQPVTVLLDSPKKKSGMTLRGNRRLSAILKIRNESPELFGELFPDGTIPAVVFADLTNQERAILTIDHGKGRKRRELNAYELFLAVRTFVKAGTASQTDIGAHFGKSRSWAQKMTALTKLPKNVVEAFKPALLGKQDETNLRIQDILFVARDYANMSKDEFSTVWGTWMDGTHPDSQSAKSRKNGGSGHHESIDYSDLKERRNSFDSPTFVGILESNGAAGFPAALDAAFMSLETDQTFLRDMQDALTEKQFADIVGKVQKYRSKQS